MFSKNGEMYMDIILQLNKFLKPLLELLKDNKQKQFFQSFIAGLILQDKYFSAHRISKGTKEKEYWQFMYQLSLVINWRTVLYKLARLVIKEYPDQQLYLITDGSPLKQKYASYRITKQGLVDISDMKNVPHNELISLALTNRKFYIPLDFKIWSSKKVVAEKDFQKKTDQFLEMIKKYHFLGLPFKKISFDAFFASKTNLKWLNRNGFIWTTRINCKRGIIIDGKKHILGDLKLKDGESIICELNGVKGLVKILRFSFKDEVVYAATNQYSISDEELKSNYLDRWEIEVFHREAKQRLGLEYIFVQSWQKLTNHVGFVCLAYALLSVLRPLSGGSISLTKYKIQNEIYSLEDANDRLVQKLNC
jgi:SRSO17 transposase